MLSTFSSKKQTPLGLVLLLKSTMHRILEMCYLKGFHLGNTQGRVPWAKRSKTLYDVLPSLDCLE